MKRYLTIFMLLGVMLSCSLASATIVRSMSLKEMTQTANVIVRATVSNQTARWNTDGTRIYTVTQLQVAEVLKGPVAIGEAIRVRQIGGSVGEITQMVSGNARFTPGEEVLVFLDRDEKRSLHYVIGMAQGKYSINRTTSPATVQRNMHGMTTLPTPGRSVLAHPAHPTSGHSLLPEIEARIRGSLNTP